MSVQGFHSFTFWPHILHSCSQKMELNLIRRQPFLFILSVELQCQWVGWHGENKADQGFVRTLTSDEVRERDTGGREGLFEEDNRDQEALDHSVNTDMVSSYCWTATCRIISIIWWKCCVLGLQRFSMA